MEENTDIVQEQNIPSTVVETAPEVIASPIADNIAAIKEKETDPAVGIVASNIAATYTPNYKVKVLDKELEIPKEFQGLMKDTASEKMVREVFEKSYGLDTVKPKYQDLKTKYADASDRLSHFESSVGELKNIYDSAVKEKNYLKLDDFFSKMNMQEDVILNWALAKVQLNEMAPEQRQLVEGRINAERQAAEYSQRYNSTQEMISNQAVQMKMMQFESALAKPDTVTFATQFDQRFGKPGAFQEEVQRVGEMTWYREKRDLTPQQAINAVVAQYGNLVRQEQAPVPQMTEQGQPSAPAKKVVMRNTSNTIPNIGGKGTSPLKSKPRSIEDLKALAKEY